MMTTRTRSLRSGLVAALVAALASACGGELDPDGPGSASQPFECGNGVSVAEDARCDLEDDCGNGADELDCEARLFVCLEGFRVPEKLVCDGRLDCPGGDDEQGCP